jgi:hypothetical protein
MKEIKLFDMVLDLFAVTPVKTTDTQSGTGNEMSPEMKIFYSDYLIDMAEPELVHAQFGQKRPIPKNGGKVIEFRKYAPLAKATTALTEGVVPTGKKLSVSTVTATVAQYGDFIALTDMLLMTAIDNNLVEATKLLGAQAGKTLDSVVRDKLVAGTNVMYAGGKTSRAALAAGTDKLTVKDVRKAVRQLKLFNAPKFGQYYVAIIHPDVAFDIMEDDEWKTPHQYVDTNNMYLGELGAIAGVRFVETTEAKVFSAAGASSANVYATLVIGENAYGVTEVTGGGLQHIVKSLGSAGTADPLNMIATAGWKATQTAAILVNEYMVRIESTSSFATTQAN